MADVTGNCSFQNPDEEEDDDEEEQEVLSLCDLPLNMGENNDFQLSHRCLSPTSPHLFEFSNVNDLHSRWFPAEEVLFGRKLIFLQKNCDRFLPVQKLQSILTNNNIFRKKIPSPEIHKFCGSTDSPASQSTTKKVTVKPRWHSPVKLVAEIEAKRVKGRPVLWNRSMKEMKENEKLVNRSCGKGPWSIIRIMSCKNHASTDVATLF